MAGGEESEFLRDMHGVSIVGGLRQDAIARFLFVHLCAYLVCCWIGFLLALC